MTETITWHPYPKEKPTEAGYYITTEIQGNDKIVFFTYWRGTEWSFNPPKLIAWAELPKAYEEDNT